MDSITSEFRNFCTSGRCEDCRYHDVSAHWKCACLWSYQRGKENALAELWVNLNGDMSAYSNSGHGLDIYSWLESYVKRYDEK